jgi:hypothetical protein
VYSRIHIYEGIRSCIFNHGNLHDEHFGRTRAYQRMYGLSKLTDRMMDSGGEWPTSFYEECLVLRSWRPTEAIDAMRLKGMSMKRSSAGNSVTVRIHTKKWIVFPHCIVRYFWFCKFITDLIWILLPSVILWILLPKWLHMGWNVDRIPTQGRVCPPIERQFIWWSSNPDRYDVSTKNNWNHRHGNTSRFLPRMRRTHSKIRTSQYLRKKMNVRLRLIPLTLTMIILVNTLYTHNIQPIPIYLRNWIRRKTREICFKFRKYEETKWMKSKGNGVKAENYEIQKWRESLSRSRNNQPWTNSMSDSRFKRDYSCLFYDFQGFFAKSWGVRIRCE